MGLVTKNAYHVVVKGRNSQGEVRVAATGFQHGFSRHLIFEVTDHANTKSVTTVTSNAKSKSIMLAYDAPDRNIEIVLSGLDSPQVGHLSVRKGTASPEIFLVSVSALIKEKSLIKAVQDGRGSLLEGMIGSQDLDAADNDYGNFLQSHPDFQDFLDKTEPAAGEASLLAWWCWAIFLTPGASIAGLAFKTCTGWKHGI